MKLEIEIIITSMKISRVLNSTKIIRFFNNLELAIELSKNQIVWKMNNKVLCSLGR
jgi:hypothetical protein